MSEQEFLHQRRHASTSAPLLHQASLELSALLGTISSELRSQQDDVQFIADAAEESRDTVQRGNRELAQAVARPSRIRDVAVALLLFLLFILLFLDWHAP